MCRTERAPISLYATPWRRGSPLGSRGRELLGQDVVPGLNLIDDVADRGGVERVKCTRLVELQRSAFGLDLRLGHPRIKGAVLANVHHEDAHRQVDLAAVPAKELLDVLHP